MIRAKPFVFLAAGFLAVTSYAAGNKPPQIAAFESEGEATIHAIRADWKDRVALMKAQLGTLALQVKQGSLPPATAVNSAVTYLNETRAGILFDTADHCGELSQVAKTLVAQIGGARPRDLQIGGGGVVDAFHADLATELEKSRKKIDAHARAFRDALFESTGGNFDVRFVLPRTDVPKLVLPGTTMDMAGVTWVHIPDSLLVVAGSRFLNAPNGGVVHVAGRITSIDAPQALPEVALFGAASLQMKTNVPLGDFGVFQTFFSNLPSRDYQLRLEQDEDADGLALDAGLQLLEAISVP
jgi:hypothetical protein